MAYIEAMPIVVPCKCGAQLRVADGSEGKRVKCPTCATILTVPVPEEPVVVSPPQPEEPVEVSPPSQPVRPPRRMVAVAAPKEPPARRIIDMINVSLLALVALCFFLPTVVLSCGTVTVEYSGPNLALGTEPSIKGLPKQIQDQMDEEKKSGKKKEDSEKPPKDPVFVAGPALALLAALLSLVAFVGRKMPVFSGLALVFLLPALGVYGYYAASGFKVENQLKEKMAESQKETPTDAFGLSSKMSEIVSVKKTPWFYLGLACVLIAALLSVIRMLLRGAPAVPAPVRRPAIERRE